MLKWLIGLLASVSSVFVTGANKPDVAPPLNTAIIAYQQTYYAPAVADLGNFPLTKKISEVPASITKLIPIKPTPPPPSPTTTSAIIPPVSTPPQDPYLAIPEPITSWLSMNMTLKGSSNDVENPRVLPEISFDREYWRIEIFTYWAPNEISKPAVQNDYFKLEIYEKGTNKLVYTMASGKDESIHKFQAFRKPGKYYFKVYTKNPSAWEISFTVSSKLAQ